MHRAHAMAGPQRVKVFGFRFQGEWRFYTCWDYLTPYWVGRAARDGWPTHYRTPDGVMMPV